MLAVSASQPSTSGLTSSQRICALLNRFEKSDAVDPVYPDMDELIVNEMDVTDCSEMPKTMLAHAERYSRKFKKFLLKHSLPDNIETMPESKLDL
jgi:hypothetical protein